VPEVDGAALRLPALPLLTLLVPRTLLLPRPRLMLPGLLGAVKVDDSTAANKTRDASNNSRNFTISLEHGYFIL